MTRFWHKLAPSKFLILVVSSSQSQKIHNSCSQTSAKTCWPVVSPVLLKHPTEFALHWNIWPFAFGMLAGSGTTPVSFSLCFEPHLRKIVRKTRRHLILFSSSQVVMTTTDVLLCLLIRASGSGSTDQQQMHFSKEPSSVWWTMSGNVAYIQDITVAEKIKYFFFQKYIIWPRTWKYKYITNK